MSQAQQHADTAGALIAKGGPPTVGTLAVFGLDLNYLFQVGIGALTIVFWCWVLWDRWQDRKAKRRRRG